MLRTRLTLKPGRPGTKKLLNEYGSKLICVRYRYDDERQTRCKTIELVIEEVPWPPPEPRLPRFAPDDIVHLRTLYSEERINDAIRNRGGTWHRPTRTWTLRYADTLSLRLTDRIVLHPQPRPK